MSNTTVNGSDIMNREKLINIFLNALDGMDPYEMVSNWLKQSGILDDYVDRAVCIAAFGKSSLPMAEAAVNVLRKKIKSGLIITPEDSGEIQGSGQGKSASDLILENENIEVWPGNHPYPGEESRVAGEQMIAFFKNVPEGSLLLTLISGGASSLLCHPSEGISIEDINETNRLLLNAGSTIGEINIVRKHLSRIKGGQLLTFLPASVSLVDAVISDVPDDDLETIGSGPTIPDSSTFQDAYHILLEYELWEEVPNSVRTHIEKGVTGEVPETVKPGKDPIGDHHSAVISSTRALAEKISKLLDEAGYRIWIADNAYTDKTDKVAAEIGKQIQRIVKGGESTSKPLAFIWYGESTVQVKGEGKGGRNQELALYGAMKIEGLENVTWLSIATDGIDGPTDAAGAIVDGTTIPRAKKKGIHPQKFLQYNDSYHFHQEMGTLVKIGPTGNNLMDLQVVLVG